MSLATELLSVLDKFRGLVAEHVNSGQLLTIDQHIDQVASVVDNDVNEADTRAKAVLGELYTALHGAPPADPAPVDVPPAPVEPAPAAPVDPEPVPVAADPQPESATAPAESEATA